MTAALARAADTDPIIYVPAAADDPTPAVNHVLASLPDDGLLAVDVETTGVKWSDTVRTIQLGSPTVAVVLDAADPAHRAAASQVLTTLDDADRWCTAHNASFDALHLDRLGVVDGLQMLWRTYDTYILASLIEAPAATKGAAGTADPRGLKALAEEWLPRSYSSEAQEQMHAMWAANGWRGQRGWANSDIRDVNYLRYAGADVIDASRLCSVLLDVARTAVGTEVIRREHVMAVLAAQMQRRGYRVDLDGLAASEVQRQEHAERIAAELAALGINNPASVPQVKAALTAELGVEVNSTDKKTLKTLTDSRLAPLILNYRATTKISGTYTTAWPRQTDEHGHLHPSVTTMRASTGRFAMSGPNLQNVPKAVRDYITAEPGMALVSADFSAIEVRVGAALAGDEALTGDLRAGLDPYMEIAKTAYGPDATRDNRNSVKPVLLGRMYGRSARSLADQMHADNPDGDYDELLATADHIMREGIDRRYPALRTASYVTGGRTRIGHIRHVLSSGRSLTVDPANAHKTFNALVQGTARELLVDAGLRLIDAGLGEHIWLSIHDEWIVMVPERQDGEAAELMSQVMATEFLGVPITVETKVLGTHWTKA